MNRNEILDKLHNINIGANVIAQTFDMGLHYAYVTPEGYGESLGTMGEWPVLCFNNVTPDFLQMLKTKVGNKSLIKNDLNGSDLLGFYESVLENSICHNELLEINKFFEELLNVNALEDNRLYVICDTLQSELKIRFFGSYKDLEQGFVDDYVFDVKTWESYTDEELLGLLDYIEDYDLTSILVLIYESEES